MRAIFVPATIALLILVSPAEARKHKRGPSVSPSKITRLQTNIASLSDETRLLRRELSALRLVLQKGEVAAAAPEVSKRIDQPASPASATLTPSNAPVAFDRMVRVMPATCTERGQFLDRRPTHRHAGIDCGGERGSNIVASIGGRVLPAPGGDRGYGPIVRVILGDDGIVYRYGHMQTVMANPGDRVETGQQIGTMGVKGGFAHLHLETIAGAVFRRHPYGPHGIDPNALLGLARGDRMASGSPVQGANGVILASAGREVDRTKVRPHRAVRRDHAPRVRRIAGV